MGKHVFTVDQTKSQYLEIAPGISIHFKKHKGKSRTWVVFIHGSGSNHSTWKPYLTKDISWIAFDLRGHGKSSRAPISLDDYVHDLKRLIDTETTGKVILVGNSFGTLLAEKYYHTYPKDVQKMVLLSPYSKNYSRMSFVVRYLSYVLYSILKGKTTTRKLQFIDYWDKRDKPIWYYPYLDYRGTSLSNILNNFSILFGNDLDFADIALPTWILLGKHDFYCKKGLLRKVARKNKHIHLREIDSHHLLITRAPQAVQHCLQEVFS